jgi:signal transduction histidine kinase
LEQPTGGSRLRVLGVLLPAGGSLIVAAELAGLERAAERLGWAPAAASALAAVVALLLGFVAARRLERRLARAGEAARAIMDGDLSRRLPETGAGDEVDRLAVTINLMLSRIEALVEAQRQVTDDIAHDLRTPLSRLRQRIEGALATRRDARADGETLEAALRELDDVLATFGTLLRIARVESGAGRSGFRDLDLSALVGDLAEAYGPVAEEAGRSLAAEIAPGQRLHGDGALLRQAVANLLDNALLHGGPSITLRLRQGPVIEVADDGPGIPPDQRDAVQRRFHRLDASRNTPGTGLGLALVAAAAQLHGGTLSILDGPGGRGVTALLELHDPQAAAA